MQQTSPKRVQDLTGLGGQSDPQGIMQELKYYQIVYAQPRMSPGECDTQNSLGFWDTNLIQARKPDPLIINKEREATE